eukprot:1031784-Alexandrium_andersonii.AAC.1
MPIRGKPRTRGVHILDNMLVVSNVLQAGVFGACIAVPLDGKKPDLVALYDATVGNDVLSERH